MPDNQPPHKFTFKIDQLQNGTFMASVVHEPQARPPDDLGALYYVVAVLLIYGCSILLMLGSYVRKNKMDQKLNKYHKEMINVRKRERQIQLCHAAKKAAEANLKQQEREISGDAGTGPTGEGAELTEIEQMRSRGSGGLDAVKLQNISIDMDDVGSDKIYLDHQRQDKMYLDLPPSNYNTDSDNDTSTEGDIYLPAVTQPAKSILKHPNKSVTLLVPPDGSESLKQPSWSYDTDSNTSITATPIASAEPSPNLERSKFDVSFV